MGEGKLTKAEVLDLARKLAVAGFGHDVEWSEGAGPPASAEDFAEEAIFVICNSGMKNTVARRIYDRVMPLVRHGGSARSGFGHPGKADAIDIIWANRAYYFQLYGEQETDAERVEYLLELPWIGNITKYHLAKNFGVDVAKPDVHLARVAEWSGETPQAMCERLGRETGWKARTVDLVIWRACATGLIDSRSLTEAGRAALKASENPNG